MVKVIMGLKGSGKTKKMVELINAAVEVDHGNVVCIEKEKNLTFDIPYQARLIYASDYAFSGMEFFKGFISGLRAGNYDITHIFIDNLGKIFTRDEALIAEFLDWLYAFAEKEGIHFTIVLSADPETASKEITKYAI